MEKYAILQPGFALGAAKEEAKFIKMSHRTIW